MGRFWHPPSLMARSQPRSPPAEPAKTKAEAEDEIAGLRCATEELAGEVRILRAVLDEVREVMGQILNSGAGDNPPPVVRQITSMPLDPLTKDWAKRLNRFSAKDL